MSGLKFWGALNTVTLLISMTNNYSVLSTLAWKIRKFVITFYFAILHKSSCCTVFKSSLVEETPTDYVFVRKTICSALHSCCRNKHIIKVCKGFNRYNPMLNRLEWVGSVVRLHFTLYSSEYVWLWIAEDMHITFMCFSNLSIKVLSQTQLGICAQSCTKGNLGEEVWVNPQLNPQALLL